MVAKAAALLVAVSVVVALTTSVAALEKRERFISVGVGGGGMMGGMSMMAGGGYGGYGGHAMQGGYGARSMGMIPQPYMTGQQVADSMGWHMQEPLAASSGAVNSATSPRGAPGGYNSLVPNFMGFKAKAAAIKRKPASN